MSLLLKVVVGAVVAVIGYKVYQSIKVPSKDTPAPPIPIHGPGYWLDGLTDGALLADTKYVDSHGRVWAYGVMGPAAMSTGTPPAIWGFSIVGLTSRSQIASKAEAAKLTPP